MPGDRPTLEAWIDDVLTVTDAAGSERAWLKGVSGAWRLYEVLSA
jgi:hypothetical protein